MIAFYSDTRGTTTYCGDCGATNHPYGCNCTTSSTTVYYSAESTSVEHKNKKKNKKPIIAEDSIFQEPILFDDQYIPHPKINRRLMFCKSGYLPNRIRSIRKE